MANKVSRIAQICMDAFYQEFKPADAFLRLEHFVHLCLAADNKLKQDEFKEQRLLNIRMRNFNAPIILNNSLFEEAEFSIVNDRVKLPHPIMSFSGDDSMIGIASVEPVGQCKPFMRINANEKSSACNIDDVVLWYPLKNEIVFLNLQKVCNPSKVRISYVGMLDKDSLINEAREWGIITMVTQFIKAAKDGVIVDMSNDQNPNVATQTEINKYLLKAVQK